MNIPTHFAAGALVSAVVITWKPRRLPGLLRRYWHIVTGILCIGGSLASHLLLDALPHYDVLYKILAFSSLPAIPRLSWVLLKVLVFSLPVFALIWPLWKTRPWLVSLALLASLYPDLEKGCYLNLPFPRWLVLFWSHSGAYSDDGGETNKVAALLLEAVTLILMMSGIYWRTSRHQQPPQTP